jgi:hypothetical protein
MLKGIKSIFSKDNKQENAEVLDLTALDGYIQKKCGSKVFDIKNFKTPLALGKYKLAIFLRNKLQNMTDLQSQSRVLFIASKVNEFLEQPESYANLKTPVKSELTNRSDFYHMLNCSKVYGIEVSTEMEINRLYELMQTLYVNCVGPQILPAHVPTGSGWGSSSLHLIIKNLHEKCQNITQPQVIFHQN